MNSEGFPVTKLPASREGDLIGREAHIDFLTAGSLVVTAFTLDHEITAEQVARELSAGNGNVADEAPLVWYRKGAVLVDGSL